MQRIQPAPKFLDLIDRYKDDTDVMARILELSDVPQKNYRHWHKFKYLKPPEELNSEAWWLATKISRNAGKRLLPFEDADGQLFSYVLTDQILEKLHIIDSDAREKLGSERTIGSERSTEYMTMSLIEEAITSSQLEGALTTRKIASDMIRKGRKPKNRHERMIFNNYRAMEYIRFSLSEQLTFDWLMHLHELLSQGTLDDPGDCGRIQTEDEQRVMIADAYGKVVFYPPPAEQLPNRLNKLIKFASQSRSSVPFLHPILRAIVLHFMIAFDHPFVDGNGRVARALFYCSALKDGYDAFAFISISRIIQKAPAQYAYAFQFVETDENDMTYFFHHQLDVICKSIRELNQYIEKKRLQIDQIGRELKRLSLNHRQLALLNHAANHPNHVYTIYSHQNSHGCAYATARADLLNLAEFDLLEKIQIDKKSLGFAAPNDLGKRISRLAKL